MDMVKGDFYIQCKIQERAFVNFFAGVVRAAANVLGTVLF